VVVLLVVLVVWAVVVPVPPSPWGLIKVKTMQKIFISDRSYESFIANISGIPKFNLMIFH
jgi:hypothetical protein